MSELYDSLKVTDAAFKRLGKLLENEDDKNIKLRIYITGGGCSGFQYGFTFDNQLTADDIVIDKGEVSVVVDPMSLQYLVGSTIDFTEGLDGSRFIVSNPNAKTTCGCGSSFSI